MAATIKDVARESGVNISTVSRALNNGYGVNPQTRDHVLAVAKRLKYRPNRFARGLVTGRSHSIALIISDIRNPFFAEVARGAADAARAQHCDLVLCNSDLDRERQMDFVQSMLEKQVDGILMNSVASLGSAEHKQLKNCGVPIVLLNRPVAARGFSTVTADNEMGGFLAAQHLMELGHRNIALITGPPQHGNLADRTRGFVETLRSAPHPITPVILTGPFHFEGGRELTARVLDEHPETTAIFAGNDVMAFGAVRCLLDRGLRIPDDVSLIGFDDIEFSAIIHPPLTTIHQPKYEMGQAAVEILLRQADEKKEHTPESRILGVHLVERHSCGRRA